MTRQLIIILLLACPLASNAQTNARSDTEPSAEMLEFLADWNTVDEKTWEILERHALNDVSRQAEEDRK